MTPHRILVFAGLLLFTPSIWALTNAIYYTLSTGSSSDYIPEYDITLESNSYSVMRDLPDTDPARLDQVDWTSSPSYSRSYLVPYTADGRLFTINGAETSMRIQEYDPVSLDPIGTEVYIGSPEYLSYTSVTNVKMSSSIVYWYNTETDPFFDNTRGYESYVLATGDRQFLSDDCSNPTPAGSKLYCIRAFDSDANVDPFGNILVITENNPVTGEPVEELGSFDFGTTLIDSSWGFEVNGNVIYMLRNYDSGSTQLWAFDVAAYRASPSTVTPYLATGWSGGTLLPQDLDMDGDYVLMGIDDSTEQAILYQISTGSVLTSDLAVAGGSPQILVQDDLPVEPEVTPDESEPEDSGDSESGDDDSGGSGGGLPVSLLVGLGYLLIIRRVRPK